MNRNRYILGAVVLLVLVAALAKHFLFGFAVSIPITDEVTLLMRRNILNQIGGNMLVYADEQDTIVVDTQLRPLASKTRSTVDVLARTPISKVIVTHWHPDHSGGIEVYSDETDVIAHENVLARLSKPQEGFGLTKPGSHHEFDVRAADALPTETVSDRLDLDFETTAVSIVHYPSAHTDGDLVVFFHDSKVIALGDLIWPDSFPYVDVHNGGSVDGLESALRAILTEGTDAKSSYRFVPGHGRRLTFRDVRAYVEMLSVTRQWVETKMDEGNSVEQIIAAGLPQKWQKWSSRLVPSTSWIEMIHSSRGVGNTTDD